jgi:hypothetical protein
MTLAGDYAARPGSPIDAIKSNLRRSAAENAVSIESATWPSSSVQWNGKRRVADRRRSPLRQHHGTVEMRL